MPGLSMDVTEKKIFRLTIRLEYMLQQKAAVCFGAGEGGRGRANMFSLSWIWVFFCSQGSPARQALFHSSSLCPLLSLPPMQESLLWRGVIAIDLSKHSPFPQPQSRLAPQSRDHMRMPLPGDRGFFWGHKTGSRPVNRHGYLKKPKMWYDASLDSICTAYPAFRWCLMQPSEPNKRTNDSGYGCMWR